MEFISQENVNDLIEEIEDVVSKLQSCSETLKQGNELDETQIVFLTNCNIEV